MSRHSFLLKIEGIELETTEMSRVAELIDAYASFLGKESSPTLKSIHAGSVCIESVVSDDETGELAERVDHLKDEGSIDPRVTLFLEQVRKVGGRNVELRSDGHLVARRSVEQSKSKSISISQHTEVQGVLISLSGADESKNARIQHATGTWWAKCSEQVGKELAEHLWGYVKVSGPARWARNPDTRKWELKYLKVEHFEGLATDQLGDVLASLAEIEGFRPERFSDPKKFLEEVRG